MKEANAVSLDVYATNAEQISLLKGMSFQLTCSLKLSVDLFSQSHKLESPDLGAEVRFFSEVVGQGLQRPKGTGM